VGGGEGGEQGVHEKAGAEMIMRQVEEAETEVRMNTIVFTSTKSNKM